MTSPVGASSEPNPGAELQPNPDQVNEFHRYADTDNSPESTHHTLGNDPNQSSPGDHDHDGRNSKTLSASSHTHPTELGNWGQQKPHGSFSGVGAAEGFNDPDMTFGADFVQGIGNGPPDSSATQWYNQNQSLGSEYPISQYVMQQAVPRKPLGGLTAMWHRFKENGAWGQWQTPSPVLLANGSVSPVTFIARSGRIRISATAECTGTQSGSFTITVTGSSGAVMNDNIMSIGANGVSAGRPDSGASVKYFNTAPGQSITITPGNFLGTINRIEWYVEACS